MNLLHSVPSLAFRSRGKCARLSLQTAWPRLRGFTRLASLLAALACAVPAARADDFIVTNTNDSGAGSLRDAMEQANAGNRDDTITFAPALDGATITLGSEIAFAFSAVGDLIIDASALPGGITVDGGSGTNRIFSFSSINVVELRNLKLRGGDGTGADTNYNGSGGAILNLSTLVLKHCTLSGNTASVAGGAIFTNKLRAEACTFSSNTSTEGGGAIRLEASVDSVLVNCTLAANSAPKGGAILFKGGNQKLELIHCTVANNLAVGDGAGGIETLTSANPTTLRLVNTIVAGNKAGAGKRDLVLAAGTVFLLDGRNIVQVLPDYASEPGLYLFHLLKADPKLLPLGRYGGPTETMPPIPGTASPAIEGGRAADLGPGELPPTRDQRGFSRVSGQWGDIGAVEFSLAEFNLATGKHAPGNLFVDTAADELDPIGTDGAGISLREAIRDVKTGGSVFFSPTNFSEGAILGFNAALGPIVLRREVTIDARATMRPGSNAYITLLAGSPQGTTRLIEIPLAGGATPALTKVTLRGLHLLKGVTHDALGGAGLLNQGGDLVMIDCLVESCVSDFEGGGVANYQYLTLDRCFLSSNKANEVGGTVGGGAVSNHGVLYAQQCVFGYNVATQGGAIDHETPAGTAGTLADAAQNFMLVHCTVLECRATTAGGGIYAPHKWTLSFSILADNKVGTAASDVVTIDTRTPQTETGKSDLALFGSSVVKGGLLNLAGTPFIRGAVLALDPVLVQLRPQSNSPALDKGTGKNPFNESITSDFYGHPLVGKIDLGAVEGGSITTGGTFEAALEPANGDPTLAADLTATVTAGGQITGSITSSVPKPANGLGETRGVSQGAFKTVVTKFRAQLDASGNGTMNILIGGKTFVLSFALIDGALVATLTDPQSGDGSTSEPSAPLSARAKAVVPPTIVGRYSVVAGNLAGEPPFAFGTLTVTAKRSVRFVGQIADGTKVSFGSKLNRNFRFRGRASLYGGQGFFRMRAALDPEGITTSGFNYFLLDTNKASMVRPGGYPDKAPPVFADGFSRIGQFVSMLRYTPPAKGQHVTETFATAGGALEYGNQLQIVGGPNPKHFCQLATSGKAVSDEVGFKFKLVPKTGLFSGTEPSPLVGGKPIPYFGVILQNFDTTPTGFGTPGFGIGFGIKLDPNEHSNALHSSIYVVGQP